MVFEESTGSVFGVENVFEGALCQESFFWYRDPDEILFFNPEPCNLNQAPDPTALIPHTSDP